MRAGRGPKAPPGTDRRQARKRRNGRVPEWLKGTGCKPVGSAYLGSNPSAPTISACVAQSVEHFVGNEEVTGSSPVAGSILLSRDIASEASRALCLVIRVQRVRRRGNPKGHRGSSLRAVTEDGNFEIDEAYGPYESLINGGVAQLVRAHGSYPWRHWFKSSHRYH